MKTPTQKTAKRRNGHNLLTTLQQEIALRIALYARVSTDEQTEKNTIQAQVDFLRGWARLYDLPIVGEYTDEGVSGTTPLHERPGASRLLADAAMGHFDAVVVYRVDRFARSLRALLEGHNTLEDSGVALKSATEPFDSATPMGKFLLQLLGSMAELERSTILKRMNLGRDRIMKTGKWLHGSIPLGYMLDADGLLTPSTRFLPQVGMTEADLVRDLFLRLAAGSSGTKEAACLQALGGLLDRHYPNGTVLRAPHGRWHERRIRETIRNPTYYGVHHFQSRFGTITRAVEPLVSQDLWDLANAQLSLNRRLPKGNATRIYLLRGLITCGLCGKAYVGQRVDPERRPGVGWYYRCNGRYLSRARHGQERCRGSAIDAQDLEAYIWSRCRHFILHPQEVMERIAQQLKEQDDQAADTTAREQALDKQLAEKHQEEERLLTVFRRGRIKLQAFEAEMDRVDTERATLERELTALRSQQKRQGERLSYFQRSEALLARLRADLHRIEAHDDREAMRQALADLVASITVQPDGVHIVYRFEGDDCVVASRANGVRTSVPVNTTVRITSTEWLSASP